MLAQHAMAHGANGDSGVDLEEILAARDTKEYTDFRDRAAYVYVTGTYPTHLRNFFTSLLRLATKYHREPTSLDGRAGSMRVSDEVAQALDLERHPMIRKVRQYLSDGWKIQTSRSLTERRPYAKIFLFKEYPNGLDKVTVQVDGSVKEGWA